MKFLLGAAASLLASTSLGAAVPVKRGDTSDSQFILAFLLPEDVAYRLPPPDDLTVLNFALTLENLEVAFYGTGLSMFSDADFEAAGFSSDIRGRFVEIMENEQTHQRVLTELLGEFATQPCTYSLCVLPSFILVCEMELS